MQQLKHQAEISELSRQLGRWRKTHRAPTPIPQEIWERAAELAAAEGIGNVARALKLDYGRLKSRMDLTARAVPCARPAQDQVGAMFMEWFAPETSGCIAECCLEVEAAHGRLRIEMKQVAPAGLSSIIRDFVRAG